MDSFAPMNAYSYMRCSGQGQVDGDTWERQQAAILAYADSAGALVTEEFRDQGVSGKTELDHRGGLAALLERLQTTDVRTVIVESSDRLARDSLVAEIIIREFQKVGATIISASGGVDLTAGNDLNPTAKLIRQILAAIAEFDRCVTVNKLRAARERIKARDGRCEGVKPYGHHKGEAAILKQIEGYRDRGGTAEEIATLLSQKGLVARSGKPWHPATVAKILARNRDAQKNIDVSP